MDWAYPFRGTGGGKKVHKGGPLQPEFMKRKVGSNPIKAGREGEKFRR